MRDTRSPAEARIATPAFELERVSVVGQLENLDLRLEAGGSVGVIGLEGSGHRSVLDLCMGTTRANRGVVKICGHTSIRSLRTAIARGVAVVPGDRRRDGLMLDQPVWRNATVVDGVALAQAPIWAKLARFREDTGQRLARVRATHVQVEQTTSQLSGGTQQKLVFAKWLDVSAKLIILDDPCRGVDVAARADMYEVVRELRRSGVAVLMTSTDLEELTALCERIIVFFRGRVVADFEGENIDEADLLHTMTTGRLASSVQA